MALVFCKKITCDWSKWDTNHRKFMCNKMHVYLDKDGACELAPHMSVRVGERKKKDA